MDSTIKIFEDRIKVTGQAGITPNIQGETGIVFPNTIIKESVEEYKRLIDIAPYYRVMLDSHIDLKDAQWKNVGGVLDNVYIDDSSTVRIDYTVFGGTPTFNALKIMNLAGLNMVSPVSTRGFGSIREVRPGSTNGFDQSNVAKVRMIRKLGDTKVAYWQRLGTQVYKNIIKMLDNFILLGWDLVVLPSQLESGLPLINNSPKIIAESAGSLHVKMFSDRIIDMSNFVINDLSKSKPADIREAAASLNVNTCKISPAVRLKLLDINEDFSRNIRLVEKNDRARIEW